MIPAALTVATPSDREIVMTRDFAAPRRLVWEAWTTPEHLPRWMLGSQGWTMPICEIDLRPGGSHRSLWRHPDGNEMEIRGVYREVEPPERLVYTDSWGAGAPETIDTLVLTEEGGRTTMTLTMLYPTTEARDAALRTGMAEGMGQSFARLDAYARSLG